MRVLSLMAAVLLVVSFETTARAQSVIDKWASITPPPVPALQSVTLDPKTTAFLALDFTGSKPGGKGPCDTRKPRCLAELLGMTSMIAQARAAGALVVFSVTNVTTRADLPDSFKVAASDPVVKAGPDKFVGTDLAGILASHGIKTVVITGTASEGAVMDTAIDAVLREKLKVVVPVDGISSVLVYEEQYVVWDLLHAPSLAGAVTITDASHISY